MTKEAEIKKSPEEQLKIILKGAADCVNREELLKKLEKGTPLTVKLGHGRRVFRRCTGSVYSFCLGAPVRPSG